MKKLFILLALLVAFPASASLYNYYSEQGLPLPSVQDRVSQATECDISDYAGTYEQNIKLEQCLRNKAVLGSATSTITTPTLGLKTNNTWLGSNTFNASTTFNATTIFNATNTFNGKTTLPATTTYIGATSTVTLLNGSNANSLHYHLSTSTQFITSTPRQGTYVLTHNLGVIPTKIITAISCYGISGWSFGNGVMTNTTSTQISTYVNSGGYGNNVNLLNCYNGGSVFTANLRELSSTTATFYISDTGLAVISNLFFE